MKKNKILISLLALLSSYSVSSKAPVSSKYDKLYNMMVKNMENAQSNDSVYKTLETILKQKNKELKNLYIEGDYIIKPEYLEWQVFATGFYNEYGKGRDNTSENARYYSNVSGYFDEDGDYILTSGEKKGVSGKPYQPLQKAKDIDLGVNIAFKEIKREPLILNLVPTPEINVAPNDISVNVVIPNISLFDISSIEVPTVPVPPTGLGSSGVVINPNQTYSSNPQFATGTGTISSGTYTIDSLPYDSLYVFTADNETLTFTGNIDINGSTGVIISNAGPTSIINSSIINASEMNVKSSGSGLEGFHSNSNVAGYLDFINNDVLNVEYLSSSSYTQNLFFYGNINLKNNGTINYVNNTLGGTKALYSTWNLIPSDPNPLRVENNGTIEVTGDSGLTYTETVMAHHYGHLTSTALGQHIFINNGNIILKNSLGYLQDFSTGIYDASGGGVMNLYNNSVGIELTLTGSSETVFNSSTLKVGTINVYGSGNVNNQYTKAINMSLDSFPTVTVNISDGEINLESNSMGIITNIPGNQTINNSAKINISGENSYGIITYQNSAGVGTIENTGDITLDVNNSSKLSAGIFHQINPSFINKGNIYIKSTGSNAEGTIGILLSQGATFTNDGGGTKVISVDGRKATGIFANQNITNTIKDTIVKVSNSGIGFFSYDGSDIKLDNVTAEASLGGILFYASSALSNSTITFLNPSSATVQSQGTAFYVDGPLSMITSSYINLNNLNLKMEDGSTVFLLDSPGTYSIGSLPSASAAGLNIDPASGNYKDVTINRGTINIDNVGGNQIFDLDNSNDTLNKNSFYSSNLNLITGSTIKGIGNNKLGMGQSSYAGAASNSLVTLINNGTIDLGGALSVGMYSNFGTLINNTYINVTGQSGLGLFGENDTKVNNNGTVTMGNSGIGIYGVSYQNLLNIPIYGDGKIDITNSGLIQAVPSIDAIGIYANNNKASGTLSEATINLSAGTIDMTNSEGGVAVYINKGTLTDTASTIIVGKNGLGLYAKDSYIDLGGSTIINLNGDNATGVYLDGSSTVSSLADLTFNINGKNTVLFNLDFANPYIINAAFTINSISPGSNYLGGNITNGHIKYTANAVLNSDSVLFNGNNSEILIDSGATIQSAAGATNVAGIIINGHSSSSSWISIPGFDAENQGTIIVGDKSIGIFGKNGAEILNTGNITVGNESVALKSDSTTGLIDNQGIITIGSKSQGIYLKNGDGDPTGPDLINNATGKILSTGAGAVGMYGDDVVETLNAGLIDLSGDSSVGIYISGINPDDTKNNGVINIGNSSDISNPSIGIYSTTAGENVTNNGLITLGNKSIGIYGSGLNINQNGTINVGEEGTGIYEVGGMVNINSGSAINFGNRESVGVYGVGSTITNDINLNLGNSNYGFILENGTFKNNSGTTANLGSDSVYLYSTNNATVINNGNIYLTGNDNIAFYTAADSAGVGGANVLNTVTIDGSAGQNNVGIYNYGGIVTNTGTIKMGDSNLTFVTRPDGSKEVDVVNSKYSVGIYGEYSTIDNRNSISVGYGGIGIVAKGGSAVNNGIITATGNYSMGIYAEEGVVTNAAGATINVTGDNTIGMAGKGQGSHLINNGTINISGENSIAMYGNYGTIITNTGVINITGLNSTAFASPDSLNPAHSISGLVNGSAANNSLIQQSGGVHELPTLVNAGIIKTNGVLALDGIQILVKPNPDTIKASSDPDYDFELSGTSIIADRITTSVPIVILPGFADGTIADVYKLAGVIQSSSGQYDFISGSLLWEATPNQTLSGADIYMSRKSYDEFTSGLWFEEFGRALDNNFLNARGNEKATKIYNQTGYISNEGDFRRIMASLAGNIYSNINQRENDIADTFEDSLHLMQNSENNTKENVKISVIGGKGKNKEETDGVVGYDYTTTGVLALREVERTYKQTFAYSLGYLHTAFKFKDGNESEELVDTIQLGLHNKYKTNGWQLRNDLTGRMSVHNIERNIDWPSQIGRTEMDGTYETYSITSDNILGKEFDLGNNISVMPYGGFRAMFVTRPGFEENGVEALNVERNNAWSAKPRAGVELNSSLPLGSIWELKGSLDFAYEYELADLNKREKAKLTAVENSYHNLSKPKEEKGTFRTKASVGVEVADRYGIYMTGEYKLGNDSSDKDDYRAGVTLKAVF